MSENTKVVRAHVVTKAPPVLDHPSSPCIPGCAEDLRVSGAGRLLFPCAKLSKIFLAPQVNSLTPQTFNGAFGNLPGLLRKFSRLLCIEKVSASG